MMYIQVRLNIPRNVYLRSKRRCFVVNFLADGSFQVRYCDFKEIMLEVRGTCSRLGKERESKMKDEEF